MSGVLEGHLPHALLGEESEPLEDGGEQEEEPGFGHRHPGTQSAPAPEREESAKDMEGLTRDKWYTLQCSHLIVISNSLSIT